LKFYNSDIEFSRAWTVWCLYRGKPAEKKVSFELNK
jgi:hypothetical protein